MDVYMLFGEEMESILNTFRQTDRHHLVQYGPVEILVREFLLRIIIMSAKKVVSLFFFVNDEEVL